MERAEDEFVSQVDTCMSIMKEAVGSGEGLKNLADLAHIQMQYHKNCYEALASVCPELDELVVTNEALYQGP